jgi:hypothetical protein
VIDSSQIYQKIVLENLDFIVMGTALFFAASILLLLFLSLLQIFIESRRKKMEHRKKEYVQQINSYIFFGENVLQVQARDDYYALIDAIIELNNFISKHDREKLFEIMEQFDLEGFLLKRYKRSFWRLSKRFFLSKLLFISSPRLKTFYAEQTEQQNFEGMLYAIYSFAEHAQDHQDLLLIMRVLDENYEKGISLKFCEFVFTEAFDTVSTEEVRRFLERLYLEGHSLLLLKGVISAIGDMSYSELREDIICFYERYREDNLFLVTYIRALYKMGVRDCRLIKEAYLHHDDVIRINLSKYALALCPDAMNDLYLYMFDPNYYVRRNFFEALKVQGVTREEIESIVALRSPTKQDDNFFLDALNAFFPKAAA